MSVIAIELDDSSSIQWSPFHDILSEMETSLGKVADLTNVLAEKREALQLRYKVEQSAELSRQKSYEKMAQVALLVVECYVLYALPVAFVSLALSEIVSNGTISQMDSIITSFLFGGGIGRCLQLFARNFYNIAPLFARDETKNDYEGIRSDVFTLLEALEKKLDFFAPEEGFKEDLIRLKHKINATTLDILDQFPHHTLLEQRAAKNL